MKSHRLVLVFSILALVPVAAVAEDWIRDIQDNRSRFWNRTVTIVGQVQTATPNPPGTTRGFYTLLDDSTTTPIAIRTKELPPIGRSYAVTGVVIQDPANADQVLIDEVRRRAPGLGDTLRWVLIGAAVVFAGLFLAFLYLLVRRPAAPQVAVQPAATPVSPAPASSAADTVLPPPAATAAAAAGGRTIQVPSGGSRTEVFVSLGAELVVEAGKDAGSRFPLNKHVTLIGRSGSRQNDVELEDQTASKEQASIHYNPETHAFSIVNESRTNPTMLGKTPVSGQQPLEDDAVIEFGRVRLRFQKT